MITNRRSGRSDCAEARPRRLGKPLLLWACCLTAAYNSALAADDQTTSTAATAATQNDEQLRERGAEIYKSSCADCHGDVGQGVEGTYPDPLYGDLSIGELSNVIGMTMPEGAPEECVGPDADAVAAYIHYSFYSEAAQIRNRPPRIGLAHLTANQLRQSLADLYAAGDSIASVRNEQGVKAIYFNGARWKDENKKIERTDPVIDFDFGHESPGEGIEPKSFYIYWEGGIRPDVTGRYEIVVHSTCSFVMHFGSLRREFINNHVQSGDKSEFRETVVLTAGRVYPFKIDFIQRERSTEQPPARIKLAWVPPRRAEEVIPARNLLPGWAPSVYTLQTELPPDDRSYGFDRGIAINRDWESSTTTAAIEFAQIAIDELWPQYERKHRKDGNENRKLLRDFLAELTSNAFRGSLTEGQRQLYIDSQVDANEDDKEAIKQSLLLVLKSPRFLYPAVDMDRSLSQQAATRLALVLHDGLPSDKWLVDQVNKDQLTSEDQVRAAARRMVNDYRTRAKTREMMFEWLNLGHVGEITKDQEEFPGFNDAIVGDLRASLIAFLDEIVWSEASDYRQLFQASWTMTNDRLAEVYGDSMKPAEQGSGLRRSVEDADHRFGVLTHPLIMSGLSYHDTTSPIHRGVFVLRYLLGRNLRPPADTFPPLSPDLHPDLTTRQRVALQTSPDACQACHEKINAVGFALENYDPIGRYRTTEGDKPIDASGIYIDRDGGEKHFAGAKELSEFLTNSDDAVEAFVGRVFQHFVKQPIAAYGPETRDRLVEKFRASGLNIRELIIEVAVIAASQPINADLQET